MFLNFLRDRRRDYTEVGSFKAQGISVSRECWRAVRRSVSAFCRAVLVLIACGASVSHARTFRLAYKLSPGTTFGSTDQFACPWRQRVGTSSLPRNLKNMRPARRSSLMGGRAHSVACSAAPPRRLPTGSEHPLPPRTVYWWSRLRARYMCLITLGTSCGSCARWSPSGARWRRILVGEEDR